MIEERDFQWSGVNVHYNYEYFCDTSGCDEEGICRCGTIVDEIIGLVKTKSVADSIYDVYFGGDDIAANRNNKIQSLWGITPELIKYAIDRLLVVNKIWEDNNWEIEVENGYYGQELDGVFIKNNISKKLESQIETILGINSDVELIHHILKLEYGKVLEVLENATFSVEYVKRSAIVFGNNEHFKNVIKKDMPYYSDRDYTGIRGIVLKRDDGKFRLIDGYHRCSKTENDKVRVIVAKYQ